jgi:hypothetical protein
MMTLVFLAMFGLLIIVSGIIASRRRNMGFFYAKPEEGDLPDDTPEDEVIGTGQLR